MQLTQEDQKKLMEIITPFVQDKSSLKDLTKGQLTKAIDLNITKMTNDFNEKFTKNGKVLKQYQYKKDNYKRAKQKLDQAKRLVIQRPNGVPVKQILEKKGNTQKLDYLGKDTLPPGGPGSLLNYNFPDGDSPNNVPEYKKIAKAIKFLQEMVQKQLQARPTPQTTAQATAQAPAQAPAQATPPVSQPQTSPAQSQAKQSSGQAPPPPPPQAQKQGQGSSGQTPPPPPPQAQKQGQGSSGQAPPPPPPPQTPKQGQVTQKQSSVQDPTKLPTLPPAQQAGLSQSSAQQIQKQIKKIQQQYKNLLENSINLHPNQLNAILQKILEGLKDQTTKQKYIELLTPTLSSLRQENSFDEKDIPTLTQREKIIKNILQAIDLAQKQKMAKIAERQAAAAKAAKEAEQAAQRAKQQARIKADQQSKRIAAEKQQQAKRLAKIAQQEQRIAKEAQQEQRIRLAKQAEDKAKLQAQEKARIKDQARKAADDACKQCQNKKKLTLDGAQQQQQQQQQQQSTSGESVQETQSSKGTLLGGQQSPKQQQQHQFNITNGQLNILDKTFNPDQLIQKLGQAPNLSQLKTIYLSGNKLGNQGLKKIIPVLSKANSLQKLSIQNNNIGNLGAIQLADKGYPGLKALKSLSVANNKIGPVGADRLIRNLRFNKDYSPNLGQINFSKNDTEQGKSLKSQFDTYDTNLASMLRVLKQRTPERSNINVTY
jgi:hypothetical protein